MKPGLFREVELLETDRLGELPDRLKALSSARNELNQKSPSDPKARLLSRHAKASKKAKPPTKWTRGNNGCRY